MDLSTAVRLQSDLTRNASDLDEAMALGREALGVVPADDPDWPWLAFRLSLLLRESVDRTGRLADLDEAVTLSRDAVRATPPEHPDLPL